MTRKFTYAVLALVMLAACQKTDTAKSSDDLAIRNPDALIISAKIFFINDIATQSSIASLNNEGFRRSQINKTPLWGKAYIKPDDAKGDVVVVPLQYGKPLHFKTNFGNGTTLSIEKQSELWIYKDVFGKNKAKVRIALPDKIYENGVAKTFEGYILEEDWFGNSLNKYLYKKGNIIIVKKDPPISGVTSSTNKDIVTCDAIDWYSCDYIDQYGVGTNCQYLYTEYVNCEGGGDDDGGGGDGGAGGGGGETGTCDASEWSSAVASSTDLESISTISEGPETRTKTYVWIFAKGILNPTLRWKSHETGVHIKDSGVWKWESLTHNSVSKEGFVIGGSLQCDVNSATPTVGIYNAIMAINYTFTWAYVCKGSPVSNSSEHTSAKPFNVND